MRTIPPNSASAPTTRRIDLAATRAMFAMRSAVPIGRAEARVARAARLDVSGAAASLDVVETSDYIALGALVASAFAVWYARRADLRAAAAERRDVERLEAERQARAASRRARLVVVPRGGGGGPSAESISHDYTVRNVGPSSAVAFWLRVVDDSTGETASTEVGGNQALAPGDPEIKPAAVEVIRDRLTPSSRLTVWVRWIDEDGEHDEPTDVHPPLHHGAGGELQVF